MKKERGYSRYVEIFKFVLIAVIFIFVLMIVYYLFLYTEKCWKDAECFEQHLARCKRATYINDAEEAIWTYEIKGETKEGCQVETTLKTIKIGETDMAEAEGKKMNCYLPAGVVAVPGDNLEYCTGPLREELQDIIIKKTYEYILKNLGQISGLLVESGYFLSSPDECGGDAECFNTHLRECERATYTNDSEEAIWTYEIKGEISDVCAIETTLKTIKIGRTEDMVNAEGKTMTCYLPVRVVAVPGEDLEYCTGPLKEELLDTFLKKAYEQIFQNLKID